MLRLFIDRGRVIHYTWTNLNIHMQVHRLVISFTGITLSQVREDAFRPKCFFHY
jgi:hypothetical protein